MRLHGVLNRWNCYCFTFPLEVLIRKVLFCIWLRNILISSWNSSNWKMNDPWELQYLCMVYQIHQMVNVLRFHLKFQFKEKWHFRFEKLSNWKLYFSTCYQICWIERFLQIGGIFILTHPIPIPDKERKLN